MHLGGETIVDGGRVLVAGPYRGVVASQNRDHWPLWGGLCGNFNGDASDDWGMQDGNMASSFRQFALSHETESCNEPEPPPVQCTAEQTARWYVCFPLYHEEHIVVS